MGHRMFSRRTLEKRVPIVHWLPRYDLDKLQGDVVAGITVGLTVIPQGMAYAQVAGVKPNYGLYSSFIGCFVYMMFGSTKDITIGPTAIMAIMTHQYTQSVACHDQDLVLEQMAVLLSFLTGIVILLATVFRIGFLITFIGRPVISGFTSAAAITIGTTQVKSLLGISIQAEGFVQTWIEIFKHIGETRWQDVTLGLTCCAMLLLMRSMRNLKSVAPLETDSLGTRAWKKVVFLSSVGRNAIVVLACCAFAFCLQDLQDNTPLTIVGNITPGFPTPSVPQFTLTCNNTGNGTETYYNFGEVLSMFGSGLLIVPLIAILENIAIASAFSQGKAIDATQEMLALGLCNLAGAMFLSIPTTGSFSRTAVNSTSGVKTPGGGFATGIVVIMALVLLTGVFGYIPKASLAAVIICAVIFMVEYHDVLPIWRTFKWDQIPLWVTFLTCLFWALEFGILCGTVVNIFILLYLQATPKIIVREQCNGDETVVVVQPALGLMFPNSEHVKSSTSKAGLRHLPLLVILDCTHVAVVDYTSAMAIKNLCKEFSNRDQRIAFANLSPRVRQSLAALVTELVEVPLPDTEIPSNLIVVHTQDNNQNDNHLSLPLTKDKEQTTVVDREEGVTLTAGDASTVHGRPAGNGGIVETAVAPLAGDECTTLATEGGDVIKSSSTPLPEDVAEGDYDEEDDDSPGQPFLGKSSPKSQIVSKKE